MTILFGEPAPCSVSPITEAGIFPISTVGLPGPIVVSEPCGVPAGVVNEQGVTSVTRHAGFLLISTVGHPGPLSGVP